MIGPHWTQRPLVSVVMSVYHPHPDYFPLAVQSILGQTLANLELIVVEDPSPRPGLPMLVSMTDERVRYLVNRVRTSAVAQRNRGVAEARGRFVAILDADDIAEPGRLREQVDFLRGNPEVGVVGSQIAVIDAAGRVRGYRRFPTGHEQIVRAMRRAVPLSHPSVVFRREVLEEAGGYSPAVYPAEDVELFFRLAKRGTRFANHPDPLVRYRLHPGQVKATHFRTTVRNVIRLKQLYWGDEMGGGDRLRIGLERLLLLLPTRLALWLLARELYNDGLPPADFPAADAPAPQAEPAAAESLA